MGELPLEQPRGPDATTVFLIWEGETGELRGSDGRSRAASNVATSQGMWTAQQRLEKQKD